MHIIPSQKNQILFFGVAVPPEFDNEHRSHAFRHWLRKQEFFYGSAAEALRSRLRSLHFPDSEVRPVKEEIQPVSQNQKGDPKLKTTLRNHIFLASERVFDNSPQMSWQ